MIHEMKLRPLPFSQIAAGSKTNELRLLDEKRKRIRIGDTIVFTNTEDHTRSVQAQVINLHIFANFDELYRSLPLLRCGYTPETVSRASSADMEAYYTKQQQARYGVLGIELQLLD